MLEVVDRVRRVLVAAAGGRVEARRHAVLHPARPPSPTSGRSCGAGARRFRHRHRLPRLPDVERYLKAIERRLEKLPENPRRDVQRTEEIAEITAEYRALVDACRRASRSTEPLRRSGWMIEELRVSYFAQTLGTAYPVSEKRIYRAMDEL